jgi:ATP-dependent Clp protease adaptor protein ClpS
MNGMEISMNDAEDGRSRSSAEVSTAEPAYAVMIHNDDHTTMEFVVDALQRFLEMDQEDATRLMLRIHHDGIAECGRFGQVEAEAKAAGVVSFAREQGHPLRCAVERVG